MTTRLGPIAASVLDHDPLRTKFAASAQLASIKSGIEIKTVKRRTTAVVHDDPDNGILRANAPDSVNYSYSIAVITLADPTPAKLLTLHVFYRDRDNTQHGLTEVSPGASSFNLNPSSALPTDPSQDAAHTQATFTITFYDAIVNIATEQGASKNRKKIKLYFLATKEDIQNSREAEEEVQTKIGYQDCFSSATVVKSDTKVQIRIEHTS